VTEHGAGEAARLNNLKERLFALFGQSVLPKQDRAPVGDPLVARIVRPSTFRQSQSLSITPDRRAKRTVRRDYVSGATRSQRAFQNPLLTIERAHRRLNESKTGQCSAVIRVEPETALDRNGNRSAERLHLMLRSLARAILNLRLRKQRPCRCKRRYARDRLLEKCDPATYRARFSEPDRQFPSVLKEFADKRINGSNSAFAQSIADAGDRIDLESAVGLAQPAKSRHTTLDRVISDHSARPATVDQLGARDDFTTLPREQDEHLHHPRLKPFNTGLRLDLAAQRVNCETAQTEILRVHRKIIGKSSGLAPLEHSCRRAPSRSWNGAQIVSRKGIVVFFILTYVFAWGFSGLALRFPAFFGPVTLWNPFVFFTIWTPTIWAFTLAFTFDGVAGLRDLVIRVFRWRIALRWYLISTVGIAALALAARLARAVVDHAPDPSIMNIAAYPGLAWYGLSMLVVDPGPIGEDPGWRGYALPRMLQRFNPAVASILLGIVWAVWHLPAFLFSGMPQSGLTVGWFLLCVVSLTVLMSWVAVNTRGAVIPAILMHWASNRFLLLEGDQAMFAAIVYTIGAAAIIISTRGQLGLAREPGNAAELQTKF